MAVLPATGGKVWVGGSCGGLSLFDGHHFRIYGEKDGLINTCVYALAEDRNKVDALFSEVLVRILDEQELVAAGFNPSIFRNLNTPEEWRQAKRQFPHQ